MVGINTLDFLHKWGKVGAYSCTPLQGKGKRVEIYLLLLLHNIKKLGLISVAGKMLTCHLLQDILLKVVLKNTNS